MISKKYKFITIKQTDNELFDDKSVYRVYNNESNAQIAIISYYKPWKQYVFSSNDDCVFNTTCLKDIIDFMDFKIKIIEIIDNHINWNEIEMSNYNENIPAKRCLEIRINELNLIKDKIERVFGGGL